MSHILELASVSKAYKDAPIISDLSLDLAKGSIGCLLGESGCGKTTLLRCIAGFESIQAGAIRINCTTVSTPTHNLPPEKRRIGMVFQDYALFPHLSVEKNVTFGIKAWPKKERIARAGDMLELVGLCREADSYPHELSGGQQQRVALARALAPNPDLLLMDEPFSNLDITLRERLCLDVRTILKEVGTSALLVTHSQQEAFAMADTIGLIRNGTLEQWDTAYNLYHRPKTEYVAGFVGEGVLIQGRVTGANTVETRLGTLRGRFSNPCRNGGTAQVLIRPDDVIHDDESPLKATIRNKRFRGANILYSLDLGESEEVLALVGSHHCHAPCQEIGIRPQVEEIILFEN